MAIGRQVNAKGDPSSSVSLEEVRQPVSGYAWVILAVVLLASVAVSLNQFKVPPLIPVLVDAFGVNLGQTGILMSLFSLTALVLALPAGVIVQKLGPRLSGVLALACLTAGSAWGAVSGTFPMLAASRALEGAGMGLLAIAAPVAIALWFPPRRRGIAMGIWATWVGLGSVAMLNLAPALNAMSGWQAAWWAGALFASIALALYGLLLRTPPGLTSFDDERREPGANSQEPIVGGPSPITAALANRSIWLLALAFACFNLVFIGFFTFYPAFLVDVRHYPLPEAAFITSLATLVGLTLAPVGGWLSDRLGTRRPFIAIPFLLIAALMLWPFQVTGWLVYAVVILFGVVSAGTPTASFAAVPEVMGDPRLAGMGMAVMSVGTNLGFVIGPALFGLFVERFGWTGAGYLLIPISLLGFAASWLVRVR